MEPHKSRQLNTAMAKSHGGFEIALTPIVFGGLGYWLDSAVGTKPLFLLVFVVLGIVGVFAKTYYGYAASMDELAREKSSTSAATDNPATDDDVVSVESKSVEATDV